MEGVDSPSRWELKFSKQSTSSGGMPAPVTRRGILRVPLLLLGREDQKRQYLPQIALGELRLQAFAVTEPKAGTDTASISTTATLKNECYVINGQKVWTSRAEYSDLMILLARTTPREQVQKRSAGLSVFLVDMRAALNQGMTIKPIRTMVNHSTTEIFFDQVPIPQEAHWQGGRWI